ncbi:MAG: hypothetical protein GY717_01710 [Rhodobacteraceae bacterium]|nr:hypothetical protein [Paracoccaceae bacterium]
MRLLCDTFFVPGVLFHRHGFVGHDFYCVALDFSSHGGFALPEHSPENGFLIGGSYRQKDGSTVNLHDILTKTGEIVGGFFDESPEVTERFSSIPEWLSDRIAYSAKELKREIEQLSKLS